MKKLKIAVIGCGNMGKHHVRILSKLKNVDLVAIADINPEIKKLAKKYKCEYYPDHKQMILKEKLNAVTIAAPTSLHREIAAHCIQSYIHTFIEKPITDRIKTAKLLICLANKNKVKLQIGHIERFNPAIIKLKEMIQKKVIGKIINMTIKRIGPFPPQIKDADILVDLAIHDVDIAMFLLNKEPKDIKIFPKHILIKDRPDHAEIRLTFPGDVSADIQSNWITPIKVRKLEILGSKGYAELSFINQELIVHKAKIRKICKDFSEVVEFQKAETKKIKIKNEEPLKLELESFVDCIVNKKKPKVTGMNGLKSLMVVKNGM